jgi:hypothetical protein
MSKHIFRHFYSLEAPVLWRKLVLSRKHFRNEQAGYYTAGRAFSKCPLPLIKVDFDSDFTLNKYSLNSVQVAKTHLSFAWH